MGLGEEDVSGCSSEQADVRLCDDCKHSHVCGSEHVEQCGRYEPVQGKDKWGGNVKFIDPLATVDYLEQMLQKAKSGELVEFVMLCKRKDGSTFVCSSGSKDSQKVAGQLLDMAILRLGYQFR